MRYHYLDNLRAILMMLGVVLHTCAAFSANKYWVVSYPQSLAWADIVNNAIHTFRMPLFFIVAGFFSILLLNKKQVVEFIFNKFYRIGLPFASALILFNLPQQFLLLEIREVNRFDINIPSITSHLWFLVNLLAYFCILAALYPITNIVINWIKGRFTTLLLFLVILSVPCLHIVLLSLNRFSIPIYEGIPILGSLYSVMSQFDYFILGAVFYWLLSNKFDGMLMQKKWFVTAVLLFVIKFFTDAYTNLDNTTSLGLVFEVFIERWQVIGLCMLLLSASKYFLNNTNSNIQKVFDASYSIYLIHHVVVVLLTLLAVELFVGVLNANLTFLIILITTFFISLGFHRFIIEKSRIARHLFNGK